MVMELDSKMALPESGAQLERNGYIWSVANERQPTRSLDCAAMARMSLSALLYHVLVGNGSGAALPSAC